MIGKLLNDRNTTTCANCSEIIQINQYRTVQKCQNCLNEEYQERDRKAITYLKRINEILEKRDLPTVKIPELKDDRIYIRK